MKYLENITEFDSFTLIGSDTDFATSVKTNLFLENQNGLLKNLILIGIVR